MYINGAPYCLRRENFSLRNMKDYGGISASRLEILEDRLKDDVLAELDAFGGRFVLPKLLNTLSALLMLATSILLHTETVDGTVVPVWEEVQRADVSVLKDIMTSRGDTGVPLHYIRIPITAEKPPDYTDLKDFIELALGTPSDTPIVVNCQLGRGRSTLASIILVLIKEWLQFHQPISSSKTRTERSLSIPTAAMEAIHPPPDRYSYQVINSS